MNRNHIKLLDRLTSEKIAAGEVVERPLSVVKELVENSIDSGADFISVELEDGGHSRIRVTDNGCGIPEEELPLAVKRFATSKIRNFDDISSLSSLGFRGEALPSIGAVSSLEIVSRSREEEFANMISVQGGEIRDVRPAPGDRGTAVTVSNLFYNTPARKKFQKSASYELSQITSLLSHIALSRRDIHFRLKSKTKVIFNFGKNMDLQQCLMQLWNISQAGMLRDFVDHDGDIVVKGCACNPELTYPSRSEIIVFVNGRLIRNAQLLQAVIEGYAPFLPPKRFPGVYLDITIPVEMTDVNVHPAKTEIKFTQGARIFSLIRSAVNDSVSGFMIPDLPAFENFDASRNKLDYDRATGEVKNVLSAGEHNFRYFASRPAPQQIENYMDAVGYFDKFAPSDEKTYETEKLYEAELFQKSESSFIPFAQIYDTYIIGLYEGEFIIIDQHAAHEKIIYEELALSGENAEKHLVQLLIPAVVDLPVSLIPIMEQNIELFKYLGVMIESFGNNSFKISTVPHFLEKFDLEEYLRDLLKELAEGNFPKGTEKLESLRYSMACKAAIKANHKISLTEMKELFARLMTLVEPFFCPHGRPVIKKLGRAELEKMFKRT